ncbi:MAG TPA: DNA-3-methyladenine glycosylase I [Candidatus Acidoferrum sp.]|nr:DNA-3-methyladenine glycosylase I [Candidatus Acidoferrum sp.]
MTERAPRRCRWAKGDLDVRYHDEEWGVPVHNDRLLFELLILEGAQAGLSWSTVLARRDGYRAAFDGFDPAVVARYDAARRRRLLGDARIIRHQGKIDAAVANARAFLEVQREHGSFAAYLWGFVNDTPVQGGVSARRPPPAQTETSRALSRDLKRRGFAFVGPTICYAFMQAAGLVNDHARECFRHAALSPRPSKGTTMSRP